MIGPHTYDGLDKDDPLSIELPIRQLAEQIEGMNYGVHRLLSHLVDVRREILAKRIAGWLKQGYNDVAEAAKQQGDPLIDGIEELLKRGLY